MNRKMVFFDIDGTLLDHHTRTIPASTREAIAQLRKLGHEVAIATGRGPFMFRSIREELDIHTYVSLNGQYVVHEGNVVRSEPIPKSVLAQLHETAKTSNHPIVYMAAETMKSAETDHPFVVESLSSLELVMPDYHPNYFHEEDIFQAMVFCEAESEPAYRQGFDLQFIRWHRYSMDVLPSGGSKAEGVQAMIERLGFRREDVYAFGDNLNDIEMLRFAGTGVAMGNAPETVKLAADVVTRDVGDDGIWHGLKAVGLL